jgi:ubiquinone biosynthesis protein UbiJ
MPIIAKKRNVEQFNSEVDNLRGDVARFEKKLAKLTKSLFKTVAESNTNTADSND